MRLSPRRIAGRPAHCSLSVVAWVSDATALRWGAPLIPESSEAGPSAAADEGRPLTAAVHDHQVDRRGLARRHPLDGEVDGRRGGRGSERLAAGDRLAVQRDLRVLERPELELLQWIGLLA